METKTLLKLANIVICIIMILGGIGRVFSNFNPIQIIISVYVTGFGVLILAAELKFRKLLKDFGFLTNHLGKGLFCIL